MAVIKVKTRNQSEVEKKPRVYFTCHPEDFDTYFSSLCADILKTHDCAIYYTEDMTQTIPEEDRDADLGRCNLFVVPVTFLLLSTPNRAMDEDIPYALRHHIPVLPFVMEPGLDALYSLPDKFAELQYLTPHSTDRTEIPYEEKLKKHLEAVLISNELASRVRAAFDAYIFLSYRKKDRRYANELMQLIHSHPECRNIAIWFDEFLTPGESFRENIEKMLEDCRLFTLLVTPQLLEKVMNPKGELQDNYVLSTELPLARKKKAEKGTEILAVEMEATDRDALHAIAIDDYVGAKDAAFRTRLLESLTGIPVTQDSSPERTYLIGLAYLEGIDVEVDRKRGIWLVTSAAEAGLLEAMQKLHRMYCKGLGVPVDYRAAAKWAERIAEHCTREYGEEDPDTLTALNNLAVAYSNLGNYEKAAEVMEKVYTLRCRTMGEEHPEALLALNNLAVFLGDLGDHQRELTLCEQAYELSCRLSGREHPDTLTFLGNLAMAYREQGDYAKALSLSEEAYLLHCKLLGQEHPDTLLSLSNMAVLYGKLGNARKYLELSKQAYEKSCSLLGEEHPDTLQRLGNMAVAYGDLGDRQTALALSQKAYTLRCKLLGQEHPETLRSLNNLAAAHQALGNRSEAMALSEEAYATHCRLLGEEHPDSLRYLDNVAAICGNCGNHSRELELYQKAYALRCKALGENHPATRNSLFGVAAACLFCGKLWTALKLFVKYLKA